MIGKEKSRHSQTWLERRSSLNENLQRKQNWTAKSTNLEESYRSWKNTLGKLVVTVNLEAIWFELNERSVNDGADFCPLWLVILKSTSYRYFSRDTVDRGLRLAILSSLLCPEMDRNIRIGKEGYVFYFTDFKKWCFDVSFLTSISVSTVVLTQGKVKFFK